MLKGGMVFAGTSRISSLPSTTSGRLSNFASFLLMAHNLTRRRCRCKCRCRCRCRYRCRCRCRCRCRRRSRSRCRYRCRCRFYSDLSR